MGCSMTSWLGCKFGLTLTGDFTAPRKIRAVAFFFMTALREFIRMRTLYSCYQNLVSQCVTVKVMLVRAGSNI